MRKDGQSDKVLLQHICERIERIQEYTSGGRSAFFQSHMVQDAVVRNLQTLAESTQRLSLVTKNSDPSVPWRAIAGFRNVLAHDYLEIDLNVVWSVVERDLPTLASSIQRMMQEEIPEDDAL